MTIPGYPAGARRHEQWRDERVSGVAPGAEIARHGRSYDTGQVIEQEAHVAGLIETTRQANPSSARDRLRVAVPTVATLLERLAARGESLRRAGTMGRRDGMTATLRVGGQQR